MNMFHTTRSNAQRIYYHKLSDEWMKKQIFIKNKILKENPTMAIL